MAKDLKSLKWIEELLPKGYVRKPMFGGFGYYLDAYLILALFENEGVRAYRNQKFEFDLWYGCLFPVAYEHHSHVKMKFSILRNHPILTKWMYIPVQTENFEQNVEDILKEIRRKSEFFGILPKVKSKNKIQKKDELKILKKIDTRYPKMFSDERIDERLQRAKKISDLKNLGPVSEKEFEKAGIKSVEQFVKLGWKKTFIKLVASNSKNRHSIFAYALIGALTNKDWNGLNDKEKAEAKELTAVLKTKKINNK